MRTFVSLNQQTLFGETVSILRFDLAIIIQTALIGEVFFSLKIKMKKYRKIDKQMIWN